MPTENMMEWVWDTDETTSATVLRCANQEVCFHPAYSSGTAAVRGNIPCAAGRDYFWEIEMLTPLYGTDVMIGVGTLKADLKKFHSQFGSLLGSDEESWGFSYYGRLQHNGIPREYGSGFCQGSIVGVHLDMWQGILTFYLNRQPLGVAFTSLKAHTLYPMASSTAARSAMRIVCSYSYTSSLQLLCFKALGSNRDLVEKVNTIPGLRVHAKQAFWHFFPCEEIYQVHHEDDDSGVRNRHICPRTMLSGKFRQSLPISVGKRQPSKRTIDSPEDCSELRRGYCMVCRRTANPSDQPPSDEGSSLKRMCFVCDITF